LSMMAYLLWCDNQVYEAAKMASEALERYFIKKRRLCVHTAMNLSLFLSEIALDSFAVEGHIREDLVIHALSLSWMAKEQMAEEKNKLWRGHTAALRHNLGLGCVLLSNIVDSKDREELLTFAMEIFAKNIWTESHRASRFRVALFHMIADS